MSAQQILVVEDEPSIAEVVSLYLRRAGYIVQVVNDGRAALASLERAIGVANRLRAGTVWINDYHIINAEVLAAMKPSAFLINIARGGVVDEAALIRHLEAGKIAGAGIDVFSTHPLSPESPFWRLPNVIVTPNVGGHSDKFVEQTLTVVEPNLQAYLHGRLKDLRNLVPH